MSKKDLFWIGLLILASFVIGRVWMSWFTANAPNRQAAITAADLAGFQEDTSPAPANTQPQANRPVAPDHTLTPAELQEFGTWPTVTAFPAGTAPVRIHAAASTAAAIRCWVPYFEQQAGVQVIVSTGGSNQLAQQILNGAPVDLFLSASSEWTDAVAAKLPVARRLNFLTTDLVLIVPHGNPANIQSPQDLLKPELKHLALAGEKVPAGVYADQALTKLGLLKPLNDSRRIVRGENVEIAYQYVLRGEAEAGIVYLADMPPKLSPGFIPGSIELQNGRRQEPATPPTTQVQIVTTFPADSHTPIVYPLVQFKREDSSPATGALFDFLTQLNHFQMFGFQVLSKTGSTAAPSTAMPVPPKAAE